MNWLVFSLMVWLTMGLELGLRDGLALGPTGAAPSFALIYLVYIALSAPKRPALWAGLVVGLMIDLSRGLPSADGQHIVTAIGPMTLGGALAAYTTIQIRGVLNQRNPLTAPLVVAVALFLAHLLATALLEFRSWYDPAVAIPAVADMGRAGLTAVYSALTAFAIGVIIRPILPAIATAHQFDPTPSAWRWIPFGRRGYSTSMR